MTSRARSCAASTCSTAFCRPARVATARPSRGRARSICATRVTPTIRTARRGLPLPGLPSVQPRLSAPRGQERRDHRLDASDLAQSDLFPGRNGRATHGDRWRTDRESSRESPPPIRRDAPKTAPKCSIDPQPTRHLWSRAFGRARSSAAEHLTFNQRVDGSIPSGLTNVIKWLARKI